MLEVASRSTGRVDYTDKRLPSDYERFGILEYWRFDSSGGEYHDAALAGDLLVDGMYRPIAIETLQEGMLRGACTAMRSTGAVCVLGGSAPVLDSGTKPRSMIAASALLRPPYGVKLPQHSRRDVLRGSR